MKFGQVVQEEMSLKDISYLELWQPLCSMDWNHLCNIGRRHHEEKPCEIIFEFGPVVQEEMLFKGIFIWSSGSPLIQQSITICAILVEGIQKNYSVKLL